ncbi:MAG: dihydrolipoyl dehydrogenase [Deltaproteobacteria bacterium]|jgi:dihydrolipoamide dehydrogenase|nr:dihydrolipoyl dehydrogenase [Deltaproteobacteria bacterium]
MSKYDVAIIGSGPGGYVAAVRAAQLGAKVALIERDQIGGVCLNKGCIPTKAMIASAHLANQLKGSSEFGIMLKGEIRIDMEIIQERKRKIVSALQTGVETLIKGNKIDLLRGTASFKSKDELLVDGKPVEAKKIIIAVGSTWIDLPNVKVDEDRIVTTDSALNWNDIPKRLAIIGGGVVGCEFACMMNSFGSNVTIVEAMPNVLPMVEKSISRLLERHMKANGISIHTATTLESATVDGNIVKLSLSGNKSFEADRVLVAIGRKPSTSNLNLEASGVGIDSKGFIEIDKGFRTANKDVFAIGDVVGGCMLAHEASAEGTAVVESIFGDDQVTELGPIPKPIFTDPEIASVGKTAEELKSDGIAFKTGRFPFAASGKALCDGNIEGQVILHADEEGKILGVHIFGGGATSLISEVTLAMKMGCTAKDLENTVHSHPTLSESVAEAAADVYGMAIHKLGRK